MKAALIGYGYWGKIIERYIVAHGIELTYIYCRTFIENDKWVDSQDIIWEDKTVSFVFVCTPVRTHFDICKAALQAGKHVFCEKPTVKSMHELCELQSCAEQAGRILYTDYIYTVSPSIRYIKENIGRIGQLEAVNADIGQYGMFYAEDDVYEVLGVHLISAIYYIAGVHTGTCNYSYDFSAELPLSGKIEYNLENGGKVHINCSLIANEKVRRMQLIGERGSICFSMNTKPNVVIRLWEKEGNSVKTIHIIEKNFDEANGLSYAIEEFISAVEQKDCRNNRMAAWEVQSVLEERTAVKQIRITEC